MAIGIFVIVALQSDDGRAGTPPPTATYVDMYDPANNCSDCHPENWDGWALTKHARAYPDLMAGFSLDYCEPCHATGAGVPDIYPNTGYNPTTNLPVYLQNVTCQTCHGPASDHLAASFSQKQSVIGLVLNSSLCGSCHYSTEGVGGLHHPTYNEWQVSGHNTSNTLPSYVKQPACASCHEAWNIVKFLETGYASSTVLRQPGEDAPLTWEIGCSACHDPHSMGAGGTQLRLPPEVICATCHNSGGAEPGQAPHHPMAEMRNNTAGYGINRTGLDFMPSIMCVDCHMGTNLAGLPNHTFRPNPEACVVCHPTEFPTPADAEWYIWDRGFYTNYTLGVTYPDLENARLLIEQMAGNRTGQDLAYWMNEYEIAQFNYDTVLSDSSNGNHNPLLTDALLLDAQNRAKAAIEPLTPPAKVVIIDAHEAAPGQIEVTWENGTASDLAFYRVYLLSTDETNITSYMWEVEVASAGPVLTWTLNATAGTWWVYVTAVDSNGNEITNALTGTEVTVIEIPEFAIVLLPICAFLGLFVVISLGSRRKDLE